MYKLKDLCKDWISLESLKDTVYLKTARVMLWHKEFNRYLVVSTKWSKSPDTRVFPGGKLDPGEDFKDAAIREVWEEVGITLIPNKLELMTSWTDYATKELNQQVEQYLFRYTLPSNFKITQCVNKENLKLDMLTLKEFIKVTPFKNDIKFINSSNL